MAGSTEMLAAFRELTTAKQLERSDLLDLLRDGIQAALVRKFGPNVKFELSVDEMQGSIKVTRLRQVVETVEDPSWQIAIEEARYEDPDFQIGDMLEEEVPFVEFGRLAVQAAKQRIIQRVREGERMRIREEFASKVGDLLSGEVQQIERGKLVIMLNKFREAEAIIPYREQNHREHFHQGDTIRAVLKRLEETPKGPRLILSRGDPLFVKALFKLEVPEIQQQIVEIRAIAREVGSRTKVAVISRDDAIDPVGACVGLKGSRVQAVVNELGGERIDIVPWSPDPERFARLALAPARVAKVFSDPEAKTIQAVVDEDQLSLAIGRNGQNVRLGVGADRLEDRSLLQPRVARARWRGSAVRPAPARGRVRGPGAAQRAQGPLARADDDPGGRRLQDAERCARPRARGHRQDPGDDTGERRTAARLPRRADGRGGRRRGQVGRPDERTAWPPGAGIPGPAGGDRGGSGTEGIAGREVLVRGGGGRRQPARHREGGPTGIGEGSADPRGPARRRDGRAAGKAAGHGGRRTRSRVGQRHGAAGARTLLMED